MRDFLDDQYSDDSLEDRGYPKPQGCFGQTFEKYIGRLLVTTIILDGSDWTLFNLQDMASYYKVHIIQPYNILSIYQYKIQPFLYQIVILNE